MNAADMPQEQPPVNNPEAILPEESHPLIPESDLETYPENESESTTDWKAIAAKLYERNRHLIQRSVEFQQAAEQLRSELETQTLRADNAEALATQQAEKLDAVRDQNLSLGQDLESCYATINDQQQQLSTLQEQYHNSQTRNQQLEAEQAELQQQCSDREQQLNQAQLEIQELNQRLEQQRRHTWQFKSALNKSLELSKQSTLAEATQPIPQAEGEADPAPPQETAPPPSKNPLPPQIPSTAATTSPPSKTKGRKTTASIQLPRFLTESKPSTN